MATLELVEKLRQHANVSYEEAKEALDACNDDLLDAVIYLEKNGKVAPPSAGGSFTPEQEPVPAQTPPTPQPDPPGESFGKVMMRFLRWCGRILHKGNTNQFDVYRGEELMFTLPITVLVLLLILFFWVVLPLAVIGLFFGFRYRFRGRDIEKVGGVNRAMDSAADAAENLKQEIKESHHDDKDK